MYKKKKKKKNCKTKKKKKKLLLQLRKEILVKKKKNTECNFKLTVTVSANNWQNILQYLEEISMQQFKIVKGFLYKFPIKQFAIWQLKIVRIKLLGNSKKKISVKEYCKILLYSKNWAKKKKEVKHCRITVIGDINIENKQ